MKFHPAFISELLFWWLMPHWLGSYSSEERQGERKKHEIYLWGHFSLLLLLLSLLAPYCPIYSAWQGGADDIWKPISWGRNEQGQGRNRHFMLKRTDLDGVLLLLPFISGFVCLFYFCCVILKPNIIDASICVFCIPPAGIHFCMCSFVFIESLSTRINMIWRMQMLFLTTYAKRLDRIISLLCNSHNIIASISWLISSFWKDYLKKK